MLDTAFNFQEIAFAFLLTTFAGLSTGLGGLLVLRREQLSGKFLASTLGLSAGVMLYISFVEMLLGSFNTMYKIFGEETGGWYTILSFFGGMLLIAIIDGFIPSSSNPHEMGGIEYLAMSQDQKLEKIAAYELEAARKISREEVEVKNTLYRTGILSALAIAIHNFPEGIASFMAALADPAMGISIAVAIAIHNVPEGISIAVPIKYATGSNKKAVAYAFYSGLAEPLGALIGFLFFRPFLSETLLAVVFAMVAGIMVYIAIDELLPAAQCLKEHHHYAVGGVVTGMLIMAITLQLM